MERMRSQLNALKAQENEIRMGLNIFKIDQPPSHVILLLEKVGWGKRGLCKNAHANVFLYDYRVVC